MQPITFACREDFDLPPEAIAGQILDLANWPGFKGYGVLPGIRAAEFEVRTPEVVGTRIRVTNTDGSSHTEEVAEWDPVRRVLLRFGGFSPPLSRLASAFEETWDFERVGGVTRATRSFKIHAKSALAWPILWLISFLLKGAVARHMREMKAVEERSAEVVS